MSHYKPKHNKDMNEISKRLHLEKLGAKFENGKIMFRCPANIGKGSYYDIEIPPFCEWEDSFLTTYIMAEAYKIGFRSGQADVSTRLRALIEIESK